MDDWNTSFLLGWPICRGYVSFREGRSQWRNQFLWKVSEQEWSRTKCTGEIQIVYQIVIVRHYIRRESNAVGSERICQVHWESLSLSLFVLNSNISALALMAWSGSEEFLHFSTRFLGSHPWTPFKDVQRVVKTSLILPRTTGAEEEPERKPWVSGCWLSSQLGWNPTSCC